MSEEASPNNRTRVWKSILTDVHFWIPVLVLLAGLAVLRWIR